MASTWQTVRVFISSTFRDMQAERDHLVRFVFPRLREELLQRRIHFIDVDLRWGIAEEQSTRKETLKLCLDEIHACRPFFIGLLGERYGWVPPGIYELDDPVAPAHSGFGMGAYGSRNFSNGVSGLQQLPKEFKLGQNYPNPFNGQTVIPLELPQRSQIKIELYNIQGQCIGLVYQGVQNAGWPKISFNASHLASGMYFYRLTAKGLERNGSFQKVSKMLLLK